MKLAKKMVSWCLSILILLGMLPCGNEALATEVESETKITVCQAGYNSNDVKIAYIISDNKLTDESFEVIDGSQNVIFTGSVSDGKMTDEGIVWGKYVYSANFSEIIQIGKNYKVSSNNAVSYPFAIEKNIWASYKQDFITYYRMQRNADTQALMAQGDYQTQYGSNPLVTKGYHPAAFLDDAWDSTKTKHYDLVGGWYDAGDFAMYSENQWVTGQMALTYLDNMESGEMDFDYDGNGIPDILDEIIFSAEFSLKMIDAFDGYGYNVQKFSNTDADDKGAWKHPEKYTDNIVNSPDGKKDDRYTAESSKSVEGTAKMAASLAATARALRAAVNASTNVTTGSEIITTGSAIITTGSAIVTTGSAIGAITYNQANLNANKKLISENGKFIENNGEALEPISFIEACVTRAKAAYNTAKQYDGKPIGEYPRSNYLSTNGLSDPLLWAEVELYLLDPVANLSYLENAKERIMNLKPEDVQCTNYWNLSSLAMQELYPNIKTSDATLAAKIQELLESRVNYFISSANDTPYGVINELGTFGVNEPLMSYVADTLRYYELFKDTNPELAAQGLLAAKKGTYWVFGNNPWSQSWVSGIGTNYTKFLHSRLDEKAQTSGTQDGFILPGALVCGPNSKDTQDSNSVYPWYEDRTVASDGANQWRYNEHSISIQIGLFYTVMSLAAMDDNPAAAELKDTTIIYPKTGSRIDKPTNGMVTVAAKPKANNVSAVAYALGSDKDTFSPMTLGTDGLYTADINISGVNPLSSQKVVVRTTLSDGTNYYNSTVMIVAPDKSPANGVYHQSLSPALSWGKYPGAQSYKLMVATDSKLENVVLNENVSGTSYQLNDLLPGTTYFWKVTPDNDILDTSSIFSFTTEYVPGVFNLSYPENETGNMETSPIFTWNTSEYATSYQLIVADNAEFDAPVFDNNVGNVTSKQLSGMNYNKTYYWKVIANGPGGSTASEGEYRSFTTKQDPGTAPGSFKLKGPDDGASGLATSVNFNWSIANDALSYTVVVSENSDFSSTVINEPSVTENFYTAKNLRNGQTYYWKVTAVNNYGSTEAINNGQSFKVMNYYLVEAESMTLGGTFIVNSLAWQSASPAGSTTNNVIRLDSNKSGGTGTASYTFNGNTDDYDIKVWYYDENDGINTFNLYVNDDVVNAWVADENLGSGDPVTQTKTNKTQNMQSLKSSDVLKIESKSVPLKGNYGEWSRTDSVELISSLRAHTFDAIDSKTVYTGQNLSFKVNAKSGTGNALTYSSFNLPEGAILDNNTGIFTWVPADNQVGDITVTFIASDGLVSNSYDIDIHTENNPLLGEFNLISPSADAVNQKIKPEFIWKACEGADSYKLVISLNSDLSAPVLSIEGIIGTAYTPEISLDYATKYYWGITAVHGDSTREAALNGSSFTTQAKSEPVPTPQPSTPTPQPSTSTSTSTSQQVDGKIQVTAKLDTSLGVAKAQLTSEEYDKAATTAKADENGVKTVVLEVSKAEGANGYVLQLPQRLLALQENECNLQIRTEIADITITQDMHADKGIPNSSKIEVSITKADVSNVSKEIKQLIGDRPVIEVSLLVDGKVTPWSDRKGAVKVSIPYKPAGADLMDTEHIVISYIDDNGNAQIISNGRYDSLTNSVVFTTSHLGKFAVSFVKKTFEDIAEYEWAKKPIEVMASKGIINGTSPLTYRPADSITRADFIILLVRTLELTADFNENFTDVSPDKYYYDGVGIARKLGIISGIGDNQFDPASYISRQDMMVMLDKAMAIAGKLQINASTDVLEQFDDMDRVSSYALESAAKMVSNGIINGRGYTISPLDNTTRAEAAVVIYNIYNR